MAIKILDLAQMIEAHGLKFLVYGDSGIGKTRLIATLPGRIFVVSAEAGLRSLKKVPGLIESGRVQGTVINSIAGLREVWSMFRKPGHGYDWVVLDSISEIAEVCLTEEKAKTKDPRAAYGAIQDEVISILRAFRDLEIGVYFTAKEAKEKDEATGRVSWFLSMPGKKVGPAVPYLFDEVYRLVSNKDDNDSRWLLTKNDGRSVAKSRSDLDPYEPADLGAIIEKIGAVDKPAVVAPSTSSNSFEKHNEDNDALAVTIDDVVMATVAALPLATVYPEHEEAAAQPAKKGAKK